MVAAAAAAAVLAAAAAPLALYAHNAVGGQEDCSSIVTEVVQWKRAGISQPFQL